MVVVHQNRHDSKHENKLKLSISLPCNVSAQKLISRSEFIVSGKLKKKKTHEKHVSYSRTVQNGSYMPL